MGILIAIVGGVLALVCFFRAFGLDPAYAPQQAVQELRYVEAAIMLLVTAMGATYGHFTEYLSEFRRNQPWFKPSDREVMAQMIDARGTPVPDAIDRSPFVDHKIEGTLDAPRCLNCKTAQPEGAVTCRVCGLRQPGAKTDWILLALILIGIVMVATIIAAIIAAVAASSLPKPHV